jgi:hypothetical protein
MYIKIEEQHCKRKNTKGEGKSKEKEDEKKRNGRGKEEEQKGSIVWAHFLNKCVPLRYCYA